MELYTSVPPTDTIPETTTTLQEGVAGDIFCADGSVYDVYGTVPPTCDEEPTTTSSTEPGLPPGSVLCLDGILYADFQVPADCYTATTPQTAQAKSSEILPATGISITGTASLALAACVLGARLLKASHKRA